MAADPTSQGRGRPLVLAATAFALGALVDGEKLADNLIATAIFIALALVLVRARRVAAILIVPFAFFFAGIITGQLRLPPRAAMPPGVDLASDHGPFLFEGIIREAPDLAPDHTRLVLDLVGTATAVGVPLRRAAGRMRVRVAHGPPAAWGAPPAVVENATPAPPCGAPGDRVRIWSTARRIQDQDFPGGVPRRALAARRGISLEGSAKAPDHCLKIASSAGIGLVRSAERLRSALHDAIGRQLPPRRASVVRAFATGDTSGIDRATNDAFIHSGLSHLLAVSGLNLAIVSGLFVVALAFGLRRIRRVSLGVGVPAASAAIAVPFVVFYTLLVGASPSAVRAAAMVLALLVARMFGRVAEAWSSLALALIVMVALDPVTLGDPSFQLSFAAVVALLRVYPALRYAARLDRWPKVIRWIGEVAAASLAATIGTAPLVARHFNRLSIAGLFANVPAAPLSSLVLVPLSLLGGLVGTVHDVLAAPFLWLAGGAAEVLVWIAQTAAAMPAASVVLPTPTIPEAILFYGAIIGLTRRPLKRISVAFAALCVVGMLGSIGWSYYARWSAADLTLTVLPVGHGDAIVAELPGGDVMLIDTGPPGYGRDAAERVILPFLLHRRIRHLDRIVITHADADHAGSLGTLLANLSVDEVWVSGDARDPVFVPKGVVKRTVTASTTARHGPVEVRVLSPLGAPDSYESKNDASLVLALTIGARRILLTGDIEADAEARLLGTSSDLRADVLKAPHHGSRTSSTEPFLDAVGADHVIFTVGRRDRFGHPHREVVRRYEASGATVWRSDRDGAIFVRTDGTTLSVTSFVMARQGRAR